MNLCCEHYEHFEWKRLHVVNNTYKIVLVFNVWCIYIKQILAYDRTQCTLFFNTLINFKLINMRNILFYLFDNHKNIRTYEIKNMRTRRIPYRTILITGLSLVRKINILLWVCKTGKVYILHARHTFPFVVYIFFKCKIFLFFLYICLSNRFSNQWDHISF